MINPNDYTAEAKNMDNGETMDIMNADAKDIAAFVGCSPARIKELRKQTTKLIEKAAAKGEDAYVLEWKVWVKQSRITVRRKDFEAGKVYHCPLQHESITHKQSFTVALPYGYGGTKEQPNLPKGKKGEWTFMNI